MAATSLPPALVLTQATVDVLAMRGLFLDPGAIRMGWCVLDKEEAKNKPPTRVGHGIFGVERERNGSKIPFQEYRLKLLDFWIKVTPDLLTKYNPDVVVAEIVPPVGGGNFVVATQSQLATAAITTVQVVCKQQSVALEQIGATTVKSRIGGSKKATKVMVRKGVLKLMPDTKDFEKEMKIADLSDAFAIGLAHWGFEIGS
jgi:Holliday junction resolvasome RuvABC endonuclease subunit